MSPVILLLGSLAGLCVVFAAAFLAARAWDNYSIVDVVWSYAFGLLALGLALAQGEWTARVLLFTGLVCLWSLRLGTHLLRRIAAHHPVEDGRYTEMRRRWAGRFAPTMFGFFQLQAVSVLLLAWPYVLVLRNPAPALSPLEIAGAVLWLGALLGEAAADAQLRAFKRAGSPGRVCDRGLWRYSRHPNYFFEWLVWVALFLFASATPLGWLSLLSPLLMLLLLLRVTGIPATEEQALRSKGEAYRDYQRRTPGFFPWFPRSSPPPPSVAP